MSIMRPEEFLTSVKAIDFDELAQLGVENILLDLDNTLLPRRTYTIPDDITAWIREAEHRGFKLGLISNNWHHTCHEIAASVDLPLVWKAIKPLPFAFFHARSKFGFARKRTIMVGDQLITDVWGAHLSGMRAIMVLPLVSYDLPHTLFLRKVERVFMRGLEPTR